MKLRVTDKARQCIAEVLSNREPGSIVALMYGSSKTYGPDGALKGEAAARWQLQVYGKEQAESLNRDYTERGWPFFHAVGDITLCIPQFQFLDQLDGKMLDVEGRDVFIK